MQAYSNPKRENDPYALPDVEVFQGRDYGDGDLELEPKSWYWWSCFPGCLPDGEPEGPFATAAEALADAQDGNDDDEE